MGLVLVVAGCSDGDPDDAVTTGEASVSTATSTATSTADQTSTSEAVTTATSVTSTETTAADSPTTTSTVDTECSASGVARPEPQPELPAAVAERRQAILSAALACDLDALAALTSPSFTASLGGGDPREVWIGDADFETFAQFGGYIGYRTTITEDGT